jgi:hypothetical protein
MLDYEWLGYGLLISDGERELFLQGEEASKLHDELEQLQGEDLERELSDYLDVLED